VKGIPVEQAVLVCHIDEGLYREVKRVAKERGCKLREVVETALGEYVKTCDEARFLQEVLE